MSAELSESDLQFRRRSWQEIEKICKGNESESEKLRKCMNIGDVYFAMTGDDSMQPPMIREARQEIASGIDKTMKRAKNNREMNEAGIVPML